ncbi:hypothetical protein AAFN60_09025 [Roseibacillus persicicus]|uniref:hypothetical protein n=1 Tax=Roseibacillus persicicus TaxID=454148 RepID=UPI00398B894A
MHLEKNLSRSLVIVSTGLILNACGPSESKVAARTQEQLPTLAGRDTAFRFQCYLIQTPPDFSLLEDQKEAHLAGVYSQAEGDKLVERLRRRRGFEVLSQPTVTTRDGKSGTVSVVREMIFPTEYDPPVASTGKLGTGNSFPVTPSAPSEFESRELGFTASFVGRVKGAQELEVEFDIKRSAFLGFINYGSPILTEGSGLFGKSVKVVVSENRIEMPVFDQRKIASTVSLTPGQYLAIGGLAREDFASLEEVTQPWRPNTDRKPYGLLALIRVDAVPAGKY